MKTIKKFLEIFKNNIKFFLMYGSAGLPQECRILIGSLQMLNLGALANQFQEVSFILKSEWTKN